MKKETWKSPFSFIFLRFLPALLGSLLDTGRQKGGNLVPFDWYMKSTASEPGLRRAATSEVVEVTRRKQTEAEAEAEEPNQSPSVDSDWFIFLLPTPTIWFSRGRKRNRKKMETF